MGRIETLFNDKWEFKVVPEGEVYSDSGFIPVTLPHDWLIYDCENLYASGVGYYKKSFNLDKKEQTRYLINFDGVYMDSTVYVNGSEVGINRYGYSSFEFDVTEKLQTGLNDILVEIRHKSPNSRWYSGAGIFRDVTFKEVNDIHIASDGVYVFSALENSDVNDKDGIEPFRGNSERGRWHITADIEVEGLNKSQIKKIVRADGTVNKEILSLDYSLKHIPVSEKAGKCICRDADFSDIPKSFYSDDAEAEVKYFTDGSMTKVCPYYLADEKFGEGNFVLRTEFIIENGRIWDITSPERYELEISLSVNGSLVDIYPVFFGLRTIEYTVDEGFFLNGRHIKINGVCEHHDLGLFGAAFNKDAMRRKLTVLKQMGVNAVRTSHNMPAKAFMELADEMGIMVDSEGFDMWRRPKTEYDYARFFEDNYKKDIRSWVRRDRNHPSVIMWSIGNEIYDCHADANAPELTLSMKQTVEQYDYAGNAPATHASNFMAWEGARNCADVLKMAGYNYGERLYDEQHKAHPDWKIYGSETCSTVQSRGVYHFPLSAKVLADDDEQCSSLGNCTTSWGAPNTEYVITMDRDRRYSQGQFLWSGFDYIGEPTPYHTKNSYFGQIDTAGFPKDTYYIFKGSWTDPNKAPFVHIFPYWDFNNNQLIDVRLASNCEKVELYFEPQVQDEKKMVSRFIEANGFEVKDRLRCRDGLVFVGSFDIDHKYGNILAPSWQIPFRKGKLHAFAYMNGEQKASKVIASFGDAIRLDIKENFLGDDILFFEINAQDSDGMPVENSNARIKVEVYGAGELVGLDNGDSTDNEDYRCDTRRLFSGKLLVAVSIKNRSGDLKLKVSSPGLGTAEYGMKIKGDSALVSGYTDCQMEKNVRMLMEKSERQSEIPVRDIKLVVTDAVFAGHRIFTKEQREVTVRADICPKNATYSDIKWVAVNEKAVETNIVDAEPFVNSDGHFCRLKAKGDGEFMLRALCYNGERVAKVISVLEFKAEGLGKAFMNPYEFISGSLYTDHKGEIGNGNEKGVATARGIDSYFGFENIDFGELGSDEVTIPIFTLNDDEYHIGIWEGRPDAPGSILLCDGKYCKKSIWNTYQPETYKLSKKLTGIRNIYFTADDKYHFKGFEFKKPDKAYALLKITQRSRIYGDTYNISDDAITGIGNNVTIEFDGMDFGEFEPKRIMICGKSSLPNNSIHLKFDGDEGTKTELLEFSGSDEYVERVFDIVGAKGMNTVGFVFLPGCDFDFKYFRFMRGE